MPPDKGKKIVIIRKKKVAGGGHHGGSWKVAYADFVTAMMAFFMVMWILGMDEKVKQAIEGYFSNPIGYKKGYSAGASPISSGSSPTKMSTSQVKMIVRTAESKRFGELAMELRQRISENEALRKIGAKVEVVVTKEGLRIELIESGTGDVFFTSGSAQMKAAAAVALQIIAPELLGLTNEVVLEGHTDAARYGDDAAYSNWELSADRANAARRVLEASGLPSQRIVEVRGLADRHPRVVANPMDPTNRRISILLRYTQLPTPDEYSVPAPGAGGETPGPAGPAGPTSRVQRSAGDVAPRTD
jgi:chemotaxis protein MotB